MEDNCNDLANYNKIKTYEEIENEMNSVNLEDLKEFAERIYEDNNFLLIALGENLCEEDLKVYSEYEPKTIY